MASTKRVAPAAEERFLILLRHGIAEDAAEGQPDEQRALTVEGHARMKQIARGLELALPKANAIYSSPLLRSMQTAMWVAKSYRSRVTVTPSEALAPAATTEDFLALIESIEQTRAIVVGHEPNLTTNLRTLLGLGDSRSIALEKGGCYGVRVLADGSASLEWLLPPRILRKLGEGE